MSEPEKVPVTERALVQRVGRKLATLDPPEMLRTNRAHRGGFGTLGQFFTVDPRRGVVRRDVKLGDLARELGALAAWEEYRP